MVWHLIDNRILYWWVAIILEQIILRSGILGALLYHIFALVLILTSKRHFSRKISQKRFVPIRKQKKWLYIHFGNPYFLPWHSVWKSIRSKIQQFCDCINWSPFGILMAGWATWCCAACFCQQARSSQRYECCWDHWQAWITLPAPATLVSNKWLSASVHLHLR